MATRPTQIYGPQLLGGKRMPHDFRDHKLSASLTWRDYELAKAITIKEWMIAYLLNQMDNPPGQQGHCTGFCGAHRAITIDNDGESFNATFEDANKIYYLAVAIGKYPEREGGATTRDALQAAKQLGYLKSYAFADGIEVLQTWLLTKGSLTTGIPWYSEMFEPASDGLVRARGTLEGYHEIEIHKLDKDRGRIRLPNSWGLDWGDRGFCEMTFDDYFGKLLPLGDAATATDGSPYAPPAPPDPEKPGCLADWIPPALARRFAQ